MKNEKEWQDFYKSLIEEQKSNFEGSKDYHSGVNDALYSIFRDITQNPDKYKPFLIEVGKNVGLTLKQ